MTFFVFFFFFCLLNGKPIFFFFWEVGLVPRKNPAKPPPPPHRAVVFLFFLMVFGGGHFRFDFTRQFKLGPPSNGKQNENFFPGPSAVWCGNGPGGLPPLPGAPANLGAP